MLFLIYLFNTGFLRTYLLDCIPSALSPPAYHGGSMLVIIKVIASDSWEGLVQWMDAASFKAGVKNLFKAKRHERLPE